MHCDNDEGMSWSYIQARGPHSGLVLRVKAPVEAGEHSLAKSLALMDRLLRMEWAGGPGEDQPSNAS